MTLNDSDSIEICDKKENRRQVSSPQVVYINNYRYVNLHSCQETAVSNHAIQTKELSVIVVQVVQLVLHFMEELRALSEAHVRVQVHVIIKEVWDGGVEEVGLELMSSIANAIETWEVISFITIHILRFVGINAQIVLCKV